MTLEASIYDRAVGSLWRSIVDDFVARVAARIAHDQRRGLVAKDVDPPKCAKFLVIATEGYFYRQLLCEDVLPAEAVSTLEPIWLRVLFG